MVQGIAIVTCALTLLVVCVLMAISYFVTLGWASSDAFEDPDAAFDVWAAGVPTFTIDPDIFPATVLGCSRGHCWFGRVSVASHGGEFTWGDFPDYYIDSLLIDFDAMTTRQTMVRLPLWPLVILLGIWPGIAFLRGPVRRHRRRRSGRCIACGYDLTGNVSGVCPECGTPLNGNRKGSLADASGQ